MPHDDEQAALRSSVAHHFPSESDFECEPYQSPRTFARFVSELKTRNCQSITSSTFALLVVGVGVVWKVNGRIQTSTPREANTIGGSS